MPGDLETTTGVDCMCTTYAPIRARPGLSGQGGECRAGVGRMWAEGLLIPPGVGGPAALARRLVSIAPVAFSNEQLSGEIALSLVESRLVPGQH